MAARELNRRLTPLDASFLYFEKPNQPAHVGSCMVYEGHISAADLTKAIANRLHLIPRYRQKIVFPPFGLAHPTWEDDPDFDISRHVEEIMLPAPADDRVLSEIGGQVYAGMLDRDHPLWKLVVLQGHRDGTSAIVWKVHHCMVDGVSGVELTMVLHDLKRKEESPGAGPVPWQPRPLPDPLTMMQDAVRDQLAEAATNWTEDNFQLLRPVLANDRARQVMNAVMTTMPTMLQPAPRMPFNGPLSPERRFAWAEFSFSDIRAIRSALGGTINDVVLTVIAGGLGRYLRSRGQRTDGVEVRAMCPVSMRRPEERGGLGNIVSMMFAPMYVGITDPVERLSAERSAMERLKNEDQAGGLYSMTQMLNRVPAAWQAVVAQLTVPNTMINTVSTNVPGPQVPLFLAGRKLISWYPLGLLASDIGLFNAILSYNQLLTIGATVDPKLMPDVWHYMSCLKESFAELSEAAARATATTPGAASGEPLAVASR